MKEVRCFSLNQFRIGQELLNAGIELEAIQSLEWLSGDVAKVTGWNGFYMIIRLQDGLLEVLNEQEGEFA